MCLGVLTGPPEQACQIFPGTCFAQHESQRTAAKSTSDSLGKFTSRCAPSHSNKVGKDLFGCPHRSTRASVSNLSRPASPNTKANALPQDRPQTLLESFTSRCAPSHSNKVGKDVFGCPHRSTRATTCFAQHESRRTAARSTSDSLGKFTSRCAPSHSNKVGKDLFGCPHRSTRASASIFSRHLLCLTRKPTHGRKIDLRLSWKVHVPVCTEPLEQSR